jgi:hypothetical protein
MSLPVIIDAFEGFCPYAEEISGRHAPFSVAVVAENAGDFL